MCWMLCWHSRPTSINCRISEQRNPTDAASVCRGASHSHNSLKTCKNKYLLKVKFKEFNIFCSAIKYFPRTDMTSPSHISISCSLCVWPWVIKISSWWRVCSLPFPLPVSHITNCHITGGWSRLTHNVAQSKQEMSGPACDRTQATEPWTPGGWPNPVLHP